MSIRAFVLLALLCPAAAAAQPTQSNAWSRVDGPSPGPSRAIGFYSHGCLAGGVALPVDGIGYEAIRLQRQRNYGHPDIVDYLQGLGKRAHAAGLARFRVGDVAQARGGPLPYGHASHQTGIDVDIWFALDSGPIPPPEARDFPELGSMLDADGTIDPARFSAAQVALLKLATGDERVDRIFVNPAIKLALCSGYADATKDGTAWLHSLRPWWGHDDHFHVRLRCPADSPDCEGQKPVDPGDGCDADLESWGRPVVNPPTTPTLPAPPKPQQPAECKTVLAAPSSGADGVALTSRRAR
jgi:penicillin-insensitive murein endopeptidase